MRPLPNPFYGVSPVALSSSCDVLPFNSAIPPSEPLTYPFRKAIILEEIRWTLRTPRVVTTMDLGSLVYVKMQLGQLYLMRDYVPIWLLGTMMPVEVEEDDDGFLAAPFVYSQYRWRLPEPLYIEDGQILNSTFARNSVVDTVANAINVQVTYVGRTAAPDQPRPRLLAVPYVAPWVTNPGGTNGSGYQQSNEFHLFNPFDVPLKVQRLTGRVLNFSLTPGFTLELAEALTPVVPGSTLTILMNDSWGGKMVDTNTGPSDVFDILRAAWTVDTAMPPKGVYEVRAWNIPANRALHVGMIGVREEAI